MVQPAGNAASTAGNGAQSAPCLPIVTCALLLAVRGWALRGRVTGAADAWLLLFADLWLLAAFTLINRLRRSRARARAAALGAQLLILFVAALDTYTIVTFNQRATWANIVHFGGEPFLVAPYVTPGSILLTCLLLTGVVAPRLPAFARWRRPRPLPGALLLLLPLTSVVTLRMAGDAVYRHSLFALIHASAAPDSKRLVPFSAEEVREVQEGWAPEAVAVPAAKPNVILLLVESLSAVHSARFSSQPTLVPEIDRLAARGKIFPEFIANYGTSEAAYAAVFGGIFPVRYPEGSPWFIEAYRNFPSPVESYRAAGYEFEFFMSAPTSNLAIGDFFTGLGVAAVHGTDNTTELTSPEHRGTWDAPSDRDLYRAVLRRVRERRSADPRAPFFLGVSTMSSHLPYRHPLGGSDTREAIWSYTSAQVAFLAEELERDGFFENGLLIITGDHVEREDGTEAERLEFGAARGFRVPLILVGAGAEPGAVDRRPFQHRDLLFRLGNALDGQGELSKLVLAGFWPLAPFLSSSQEPDGVVFATRDHFKRDYPFALWGNRFLWMASEPPGARELEQQVQRQRALGQALAAGAPSACPEFLAHAAPPSAAKGALLTLYRTPDPAAESFVRRETRTALASLAGAEALEPPFSGEATSYLDIAEGGTYWFWLQASARVCLWIDGVPLFTEWRDQHLASFQRRRDLAPGLHRLDLAFSQGSAEGGLKIGWLPPGQPRWEPLPGDRLVMPAAEAGQ